MSAAGIIVTARTGSARLPRKALLPLGGQPMIAFLVSRLRPSNLPVIVATVEGPGDDELARAAAGARARVFRGSETDVVGRVLGAARANGVETIVFTWGDSPLMHPEIVDLALGAYRAGGADLVTTKKAVPQGLDCEVFSTALLAVADVEAQSDEREHVTGFIHARRDRFRVVVAAPPPALAAPELVLTVDDRADYDAMQRLVERLGDPHADGAAIVRLLRSEPALARLRSLGSAIA